MKYRIYAIFVLLQHLPFQDHNVSPGWVKETSSITCI